MIPSFTTSHVLPPFTGSDATDRAGVSPYDASISEVAARLSTSPERVDILRGLLLYRETLRQAGVTGYQWLGGSFCEAIELSALRPPNDIDVVTIGNLPPTVTNSTSASAFLKTNPHIFRSAITKWLFKCDAYFLDSRISPNIIVDDTVYWFGLFSHRRDGLWKGLIRVPLISDDLLANAKLRGFP